MSVLRRAKLRTPDGTESIEYPLGVEAENVEVTNGENLSQRLVKIDEDLIQNKEDITIANEIAVINRQNALERRSISIDKKPYYFNTVADMKTYQGLVEGDMAITLGYYEANDGGKAEYYVTENVNNITTNDGFHILLDNGLVANLLIENNTVSILQIGGKRQKNNVHFDNKNTILAYINKNKNSAVKFSLFFPYGIYYTSPVQINSNHFSLIGETTVTGSSIITAIANQEYVIKVGDYSNGCGLNKISNLTISSAVYNDYLAVLSYHEISIACLVLSFTYFLSSEYLEFSNIKGTALKIDSSWEL